MKTFYEFMNTSGLTPDVTMPTMGPEDGQDGQQGDEEILSQIGNSLRKVLQDKLFPAMDRHQLNRQKAMDLLTLIVQEVSDKYNLNTSQVKRSIANTKINTGI